MAEQDPDDEHELFLRAMVGVKPLHYDKRIPDAPRLRPVPRQRLLEEQRLREDMLSEYFDPADLETGEELIFLRPGVQHSVLRKLRRGFYSVRVELDLHGLLVREARAEITAFLRKCRQRRISCVRIIHGKGHGSPGKQPVLKVKLNHWLRQYDEVLAFCSARDMDGGTGAVYVLLKSLR